MGIQGLIPFLKKASRQVNVKEFSGCTVGVDAYCWLHKGAFGCAEKLGKGQPTDGYILYCLKMVNLLLSMKITPILVFDGRRLPAKENVEINRRELRERNKAKAKEFLREGKLREARECFQRCVDITPEMALDVIKACQKIGVDCIVAPYEADAQLAYLNKKQIIQLVITEDSDLVLFGCDYILFKMDSMGFGVLVEQKRLHLCMNIHEANFSFEKFRYMCIMSGCDYVASLPGIGLAKSCKFFSRVTITDLRHILGRIPSHLRMYHLNVTEEYRDDFLRANNTFLHQLVFDPQLKKLVPLNPYPDHISPSDCQYAGSYLPDDVAYQLALGNVNVNTMQVVAYFDPERDLVAVKSSSWKGNRERVINSIWSENFVPCKFDMENIPVVVESSPTKGKEMVVDTKFLKEIVPRKIIVKESNDDFLAKIYFDSEPPRKKVKAESSPEKPKECEKSLLSRVLLTSKIEKNIPRSSNEKISVKKCVTSKYFSTPKTEKISWFEQIENEYEEINNKSTDCIDDKESSLTKLESPVKNKENNRRDEKLLMNSPTSDSETDNNNNNNTQQEEESPLKFNSTPKTPSNFTWKKLDEFKFTYLKQPAVTKRPFKSPGFITNRRNSIDSLNSSQSSLNLSQPNNSIDTDSFNQSQNTTELNATTDESDLETPKKIDFWSTNFTPKNKNNSNRKRRLGGTCRQTGLCKKNKLKTDKRQPSITDTLQKFRFTQSQQSLAHA